MDTGLSTEKWTSFIDAKQFLACGSARSVRPRWLDEEELALLGLQEKCQLEMKAAAEAQREASGKVGDPLEYPFSPSDIGGNPTLTVMTLDTNLASWTPSCPELYAEAMTAMNLHQEKVQKLRSAGDWIVTAWRVGTLELRGRNLSGSTAGPEVIDPYTTHLGDVEFRDVGDKVTGFRTDMFVVEVHAGCTTDKRRLYEDVVMDRVELIKLAQSTGADTVNKTPAAEPGTQLLSLSPDGMPGLADPKVNPANATNLGVGSVPQTGSQKIALEAIAALGLEQIAPGLPDKELHLRIGTYCSAHGLPTPCSKTIRRAIGKDA